MIQRYLKALQSIHGNNKGFKVYYSTPRSLKRGFMIIGAPDDAQAIDKFYQVNQIPGAKITKIAPLEKD